MSKPRRRVVASIEARMGSSRLPGKVLADVQGQPALSRLLQRLRLCRTLDGIVLATTDASSDDVLEAWASDNAVACHRGSVEDVLQRVVDAQRSMNSDIVVEITGDCILTDPALVDLGVDTFFANDCDVVSTEGRFASWPMGQCVQVFTLAALEDVARTIDDPAVREHVSLYFYEHPERYRLIQLVAPRQWQAPHIRTHLDYPEDLLFINEVQGRLEPQFGACFGIEPLTELLRREPKLAEVNAHCREKTAR
jgi:spore coat polysaccharide biosynthesis protein SpsF